jgi:hypothetical protein
VKEWTAHSIHTENEKYMQTIRKPVKVTSIFEDVGANGNIILKWILQT